MVNNFIDKTADIFISHREYADYKFALKLRHDRIIIILEDLFKQSDLTKIESLLANGVLQPLQYDFNKYTDISLFKFRLVCEIKRKRTDKPCKKFCLMVQGYNDLE